MPWWSPQVQDRSVNRDRLKWIYDGLNGRRIKHYAAPLPCKVLLAEISEGARTSRSAAGRASVPNVPAARTGLPSGRGWRPAGTGRPTPGPPGRAVREGRGP